MTAPSPLRVSSLALAPHVADLDLCVEAGECAVVAASVELAAALADVVCGLAAPTAGDVAVFGEEWGALSVPATYALRGRIGRLGEGLAWIQNLNVDENVVMPMLDRTSVPESAIREEARALARHLGLDDVPRTRPHQTSRRDLAAAAAVRAFLGAPALLLLEPVGAAASPALRAGLVALTRAACTRGAAVVLFADAGEPGDLPAGPRLDAARERRS